MKLEDFPHGTRVAYVPAIADGDLSHPSVEFGKVSSNSSKYVFVRFDRQVKALGWKHATSMACDPDDLKILTP